MAEMDAKITSFFTAATQELFYNVVFRRNVVDEDINGYSEELCDDFKRQTGYEPMEFFGLENISGLDWFDFLETSPGFVIDGEKLIIDLDHIWRGYNTRFLYDGSTTVAAYREKLIVRACQLLASGKYRDSCSGDTVLHFVAALPGASEDELCLMRYLVQSGVIDPLQSNKKGINILHIIAARLEAKISTTDEEEESSFGFTGRYIDPENWEIEHREKTLELLSDEFSPEQLSTLMTQSGRHGNTVMHEWVLSTSCLQGVLFKQELKIAIELLHFNSNLWLQNQTGLFPLHFASNSTVFTFLLGRGASARVTNGRNETPFLFILKYLVALAFVDTPYFDEIEPYLLKTELNLKQSLSEAVVVLGHLLTIVNENEDVKSTLWMPDIECIYPLEMIAVAIRCASYYVDAPFSDISFLRNLRNLRDYLAGLLHVVVEAGNTADLRRQNERSGENALHVLLNVGSIIYDDSALLQSLQVLLKNGVELNAVDSNGKTVLDIVHELSENMPLFSKKCTDVIENQGQSRPQSLAIPTAQLGLAMSVSSAGSSSKLVSSSPEEYDQASTSMLQLSLKMERKLRSFPKYHYDTVRQLATSADADVTVVEKYRYLNEKPIGSGAFSSIYVAIKDEHVDTRTARIECRAFALKRLEKGKVRPEEIMREVQALLSVSQNCENILNCYESFQDEFFHYLCLDLMDGDLQHFVENATAKAIMEQKRSGPAKAVQDIINGLTFLHQHDYLHRDLKPGNVLYTVEPSLNFKIGDFGLAKDVSSLSMMTSGATAMVPGTRCWMAPELISLQSHKHTKQSDVFALGLVLHFLLTFGKHPFAGDEPAHVTERKIAEMKVCVHGSIPSDAAHFLEALLAQNPRKRPPVEHLTQHPFLWSERKKIELLRAVGDQQEAANPNQHPNSVLERGLRKTKIAGHFAHVTWDRAFPQLYLECTCAWKQKRYRTDNVLDLTRFIRNAYAHREERSRPMKHQLDNYIFLTVFPSLVMEVLNVVQTLNYDEDRSNIRQALEMI